MNMAGLNWPRVGVPGGGGVWLLLLGLAVLHPVPQRPLSAQVTVIRAERLMTSAEDGIVGPRFLVVRGGRIASVTIQRPSGLPPAVQEFEAEFVTPGFIDARTTLGLSGLHPGDDDRDETSGPNQAHLRAVDAFDLSDPLVGHSLRNGTTTVQTGPGDANSIGGQAGIFKLHGESVAGTVVRFPSGVVFSLDESAKLTYGAARQFPSTRMANVGLIRQALVDADRYRDRRSGDDPPPRDLRKEALAKVLEREIPALVSAERADEIATALRLAGEFGFESLLVGATQVRVALPLVLEANVPVLLGPPGEAALRTETGDLLPQTASELGDRGIRFALVTGDDEGAAQSSLLVVARSAIRGGLTLEKALEAITISPARILGLDADLGSVEEGKVADLVLFDGDPGAASTRVAAVFVEGTAAYVRGR